jgi:monoamine oxidase
METYDVIIVGAGMAGLYCAHKILKKDASIQLLILEQNEKPGGRAKMTEFHGVNVNMGAGVGRKKKDVLLNRLLKELDVPTHDFQSSPHYASTLQPACNVASTFQKLKERFHKNPKNTTFEQFAQLYLSKTEYEHFVECAGYRDYERESVRDTLYDYGFDDNFSKWTAVSINWNQLVEKLVESIGSNRILCNQSVTKIHCETLDDHTLFDIHTSSKKYITKQVVLATTIESLLRLVPTEYKPLYKQIHGQPFLRTYAKMSEKSVPLLREKVPGVTIVPGPLQKMISMNPDKGVYMIAYADNRYALQWKSHLENTERNRNKFARAMEKAFGLAKHTLEIEDMISFFWNIGTHYYEPLSYGFKNRKAFLEKVQCPRPGWYVVGEMVSMNQGWVEGALESVDAIL